MMSNESNQSERAARNTRGFDTQLLSKQGQIVASLAGELLSREPGDYTLRVQEYATLFNASVGTVQSALNHLQHTGAARLEGHGRRGTVIRELRYSTLWSLALGRAVVGGMPLPYTKRFEGLATGIRLKFSQEPMALDLRFTRGATSRLQMLSSREYDWVILSRFAAETANAHGFDIEIVMTLEPQTYQSNQIQLFAPGVTSLQDGLRIGIDPKSPDHSAVVRVISRGKQVDFVEIDYSQGLNLIRSGVIDATVWSREDVPMELEGLTIVSLDRQADPIFKQTSEAAIVVNREDCQTIHILKAILNSTDLHQIQQEVVQRLRLPMY